MKHSTLKRANARCAVAFTKAKLFRHDRMSCACCAGGSPSATRRASKSRSIRVDVHEWRAARPPKHTRLS